MHAFPTFADAFENIGGEIVVLQVLDAVLDEFAQVIGLGAPGLGGEKAESLLGFGGQANRGRQEMRLYMR